MSIILPKKVAGEAPVATDDETHSLLIEQGLVSARNQQSATVFGPAVISNNQSTIDTTVSAPVNAASNAVFIENTNSSWINNKWRPAMGWVYMATCICDFIIFPILWSMLQAVEDGSVVSQWKPLTLQGAGLYHIAMGAVLGIAAYGRTQEKLAAKAPINT